MDAIDSALFDWINELAGHSALVDKPLEWAAQYLVYAIAVVVAGSWFFSRRESPARPALLQAAIAVGLAVAATLAIQHLDPQPRPFAERGDVHLLIAHGADATFPSEHVTVAAAAAGTFFWNRHAFAAPLLLGTAVLALARIFVGFHYPTDVAAGFALGLAASFVVALARRPVDDAQRHLTRLLPSPLR